VLHAAGARRDGRLLVLGGLLLGLAVQSHVGVLVIVPGLVVWFLTRPGLKAWLRRPSPYLAVGAALLGYGNMIAYNLFSGRGILADARRYHAYAWSEHPTWNDYLTNVRGLLQAMGTTLGGNLPRVQVPLQSLVAAVILIWLVAGLFCALRRGETLPFLVFLSTGLLMPYVNKKYSDIYSQRYIAYLAPVGFAAMGVAVSAAIDGWRKRGWPGRRAVAVAVTVAALLVAVAPARAGLAFCQLQMAAGKNNSPTLFMATTVDKSAAPGDAVYLSQSLRGERLSGGLRFLRSLSYLLTMGEVDHETLTLDEITGRLEANPSQEAWLALTPADYDALSQKLPLERIEGGPPAWNEAFLARYTPAGQAP
jgi:hypothetical protein